MLSCSRTLCHSLCLALARLGVDAIRSENLELEELYAACVSLERGDASLFSRGSNPGLLHSGAEARGFLVSEVPVLEGWRIDLRPSESLRIDEAVKADGARGGCASRTQTSSLCSKRSP